MEASSPPNPLQMGLEKLRQGQLDDAIQLLQNAVQAEPGDAQAHAYLGVAYCQKKEFDASIRELLEARKLDPSSASIAFNLGVAYHSSGDANQARAFYEAALQLDPGYQKAKTALERMPAPRETPATAAVPPGPASGVISKCPACSAPVPPAATYCGACGLDLTPILRRFIIHETTMSGQEMYTCSNCKALVPDIRAARCQYCNLDFKTGILAQEAPVEPSGGYVRAGEQFRHGQTWVYASFWRRFAGLIIDGILLSIVWGIIAWPMAMGPFIKQMQQKRMSPTPSVQAMKIVPAQMQNPPIQGYPGQMPGIPGNPRAPIPPEVGTMIAGFNKVGVLSWLIKIIYYTLMIGLLGQTVGMMALGMRCIRPDGSSVGIPRAFLRWLVSIISGIVICIGYLWMLWDERNQTWHDKAADTIIVTG